MGIAKATESLKKINPLSSSEESEIENRIRQLRKDLASLADTLQRAGSEKADEYRESVDSLSAALSDATHRALDTTRDEAIRLERTVRRTVADNPMQSLLVAAGIGFLIAFLNKR